MTNFKESYFALPESERNKMQEASLKWISDLKSKMGKKFMFYMTAGFNGAYSVSEFDTYEEYARSLMSPAFMRGLVENESIPLIEVDEKAIEQWRKMLKPAR